MLVLVTLVSEDQLGKFDLKLDRGSDLQMAQSLLLQKSDKFFLTFLIQV